MITEIEFGPIGSYTASTKVSGLSCVNFFFGSNGAGKTTLANVVNAHFKEACLTYNRRFIEDSFQENSIPSIITIGAEAVKNQRDLIDARELVGDLSIRLNTLRSEIDKISKDLQDHRDHFDNNCWRLKSLLNVSNDLFKRLNGSKRVFADAFLQAFDDLGSSSLSREEIEMRAAILFDGKDKSPIKSWQPLPVDLIASVENAEIFTTMIVGHGGLKVAHLISHLGAGDWVRNGLPFLERTTDQCPFCQQPMDKQLMAELQLYFDQKYEAAIEQISSLGQSYRSAMSEISRQIDTALIERKDFINVEKLSSIRAELMDLMKLNADLILAKQAKPSVGYELLSSANIIRALVRIFDESNSRISEHNAFLADVQKSQNELLRFAWMYLKEHSSSLVEDFLHKQALMEKLLSKTQDDAFALDLKLNEAVSKLSRMEEALTSVRPSVGEINQILHTYGYAGFRLEVAGNKEQFYRVVRPDGANALSSLSEGERSFLTFLWFYCWVKARKTLFPSPKSSVIVFDDPVSSLDADALFVVSALAREFIEEAKEEHGPISQVFLFTHNVFFFREVSFDHTKVHKKETFWVIRKQASGSVAVYYKRNPVKTSYQVIWEDFKSDQSSPLSLQNTMRRIIEYYFVVLGGQNKHNLIQYFTGDDRRICKVLLTWTNSGSHAIADDMSIEASEEQVEKYKEIFRQIFHASGHGTHYDFMMRDSN